MSLENQMFELITKRDFSAALSLLESNKVLNINALDKNGNSFLMSAVLDTVNSQERYTLVEKILSHPDFKLSNTPITDDDATPFTMAVFGTDSKMVDLMLRYQEAKGIEVLWDNEKLLYTEQSRRVQIALASLAEDPQSSLGKRLDEKESILASLLQAAVYHAIHTDDDTLLQRLKDAGAKLYFPLKDGKCPINLVQEEPDLKVHQWLKKYIQDVIAASPEAMALATQLKAEHQAELSQMLDDFFEETAKDIARTCQLEEITENTARKSQFFKSQIKDISPKEPDPSKPSSGPGVRNG